MEEEGKQAVSSRKLFALRIQLTLQPYFLKFRNKKYYLFTIIGVSPYKWRNTYTFGRPFFPLLCRVLILKIGTGWRGRLTMFYAV
jgi:hypothetical protein